MRRFREYADATTQTQISGRKYAEKRKLMDIAEALKTIRALAEGLDPESGHMLPGDSVCRKPLSVKALNRAVGALIAEQQREKSRAGNSGKYWTGKEDAEVCEQVRNGMDFHDIAKQHNRSVASIVARLIKLGKITPQKTAAAKMEKAA